MIITFFNSEKIELDLFFRHFWILCNNNYHWTSIKGIIRVIWFDINQILQNNLCVNYSYLFYEKTETRFTTIDINSFHFCCFNRILFKIVYNAIPEGFKRLNLSSCWFAEPLYTVSWIMKKFCTLSSTIMSSQSLPLIHLIPRVFCMILRI